VLDDRSLRHRDRQGAEVPGCVELEVSRDTAKVNPL
jgi:hypothetical protein